MRAVFKRTGSRNSDAAVASSSQTTQQQQHYNDDSSSNNSGSLRGLRRSKRDKHNNSSARNNTNKHRNNNDDLLLLQEKQKLSEPTIASLPPPPSDSAPPPPTHRRTGSSVVKKHAAPSINHFMATTPITKHYQLNAQILSAFDSHYEAKLYQVAFAMGLTYCETALIEIPKHGYYNSKRHERERMQSSLDAVRVSSLLAEIQDQYDQVPHSPVEKSRVQKLQTLALEAVQRASQDQYEAQRAAAEQELRQQSTAVVAAPQKAQSQPQEWVLLEPLLSCQDTLSNVLCPPPLSSASATAIAVAPSDDDDTKPSATVVAQVTGEVYSEREAQQHPLPVAVALPVEQEAKPPGSKTKQRVSLISDDTTNDASDWIHIQRQQSADDLMLEKALYLSGLEILPQTSVLPPAASVDLLDDKCAPSDDVVVVPETRLMPGKSRLQLATLARLYHEDFDSLVNELGRIQLEYIDTFQGRLPGSTNGCTVIAPLLCIHHLLFDDNKSRDLLGDSMDEGLDAMDITQVIDQETPAILAELRTSLGLSDQAFLIPADVHDYLIQNGQLHTTQFVNVVGGNLLDEGHLHTFVDSLSGHGSKTKLAATLFFHEHVVAILKLRRSSSTEAWYDVIDSLPLQETLQPPSDHQVDDQFGYLPMDVDDEVPSALDQTVRFRCLDKEALKACLRWYACSKFTNDNITYIDTYDTFDAQQSDFDPRVFQAYIWQAAEGGQ